MPSDGFLEDVSKLIWWVGMAIGLYSLLFQTDFVFTVFLYAFLGLSAVPTETWGVIFIIAGYLVLRNAWEKRRQ